VISSCTAAWYDGRTSQRREVTLTSDGRTMKVVGEGLELSYSLSELRIEPGLGSVRRLLRFPDGATAETTADDFVTGLQVRQGTGGFFRNVHRWETSLRRALAALVLLIAVAFGFVRYGLPFLAAKAAFALPPASEELLGRETLALLDRLVLKPTALPAERQKALRRQFAVMTAGHPEQRGWRLELRSSEPVGANAFALPSGIVIVTDQLLEIAKSDEGLAGVLAHEIGHLQRRHALRHLLQNSATVLLVATLTGDITSITSLAATMPTALIDAKFSRDFEREADDAAVAYLKGKGIPVREYAEMLAQLDAAHWKERETASGFGDFLGDHPQMLERVKRVLASGEK